MLANGLAEVFDSTWSAVASRRSSVSSKRFSKLFSTSCCCAITLRNSSVSSLAVTAVLANKPTSAEAIRVFFIMGVMSVKVCRELVLMGCDNTEKKNLMQTIIISFMFIFDADV